MPIATLFHRICNPLIIWFPAYWSLICVTWVYSYDKFEARKSPFFIWNNFYFIIINEFRIVMHTKWRSAFQPEIGLKGIWKKWKGGFKALCKFVTTISSYLLQICSILCKKNTIQYWATLSENILIIGDHQLSCSGFIELIGTVVYVMQEICRLVPVLHFV